MQTLWLLKDRQEVKVCLKKRLPQHQLDGIRFLYRQYKLKYPGVILNDPSGYGKRLQVALFLNAVCPLLKESRKAALILCDDHDVDNWAEHFEQWTDCRNEVAVTSPSPFTKHTIFVNPHKDCLAFTRRWGVLIICSNVTSKELLQTNLNADFKIWITNIDIEENLPIFSSIYEWLCPNEVFTIKDFTSESKDPVEVLNKKIYFDAFTENIVLRRTDFDQLFDVSKKPNLIVESPRKTKNKDPTGSKVKRSNKRKTDEDNVSSAQAVNENELVENCDSVVNNGVLSKNNRNTRQKPKRKRSFSTDFLDVTKRSDAKQINTDAKDDLMIRNAAKPNDTDSNDALFNFVPKNNEEYKNIHNSDVNKVPMALNEIENENFSEESMSTAFDNAINEIIVCENPPEKIPDMNYQNQLEMDAENKTSNETDHRTLYKKKLNSDEKVGAATVSETSPDIIENSVDIETTCSKISAQTKQKTDIAKVCPINNNLQESEKNNEISALQVNEKAEPSKKAKNTVLNSLKDVDDRLLECEKQAMNRFKGSFFDSLF